MNHKLLVQTLPAIFKIIWKIDYFFLCDYAESWMCLFVFWKYGVFPKYKLKMVRFYN